MKKVFKKIFLVIFLIILFFAGYLFIGRAPEVEKTKWGVNFSHKHARDLGLDWKENYLALIDDLGVKNIKLAVYWDLIEKEEGFYDFQDLDWQIKTAEKKGVELFLVMGMKVPRWPECHIPDWAEQLDKEKQQEKILKLLKEVVLRYQDSSAIWAWQVENEIFFPFGNCPWSDRDFLKKEIDLVRSLDMQKRPVIISDSGEGSFWFGAAKLGDIVGTTMYRKVWFHRLETYVTYPLPPVFYARKAKIIEKLFGKKVINVELQAEPWGPKLLYDSSLEEQEKTMNLEQFKKNINFAKKTGFDTFYLWGAEWWYWMKIKQDNPEIWQEAKKLF